MDFSALEHPAVTEDRAEFAPSAAMHQNNVGVPPMKLVLGRDEMSRPRVLST